MNKLRHYVWAHVRFKTRKQVWDQTTSQVRDQVGCQQSHVCSRVWSQVNYQVMDQVWHSMIRQQIPIQARQHVWHQVKEDLGHG